MEGGVNESLITEVGKTKEEGTLKDRVWTEWKKMWIVAGPAIFTRFSTFGVSIISQAFIGHIGATELAAFALVSTVLLRFGNGVLVHSPLLLCFPFILLFVEYVPAYE